MDYRGPDGIRHWTGDGVALGHCMMRTTEESLSEVQPLCNEDESLVLVMDGYLTNWEELRRDLLERGARLRTRSDAELVLRAYEMWGGDCPRHIDGEYAFLVWDARRREAFCARDHQGLRPFQYHWDGKALVVGSDVAVVLAGLESDPPLNRGLMAEFMANDWLTRGETVWQGIMRVLPAHSMRVGRDGPRQTQYWELPLAVKIRYRRDQDYFDHYRHLLLDCARRASRSHYPLAFEVSGGLDSSALFSLAHALEREGKLPAPSIKGYTLAGPKGTDADEVDFAQAVARHVGIDVAQVPMFMPGLDWFAGQSEMDRDLAIYPNGAMSLNLGDRLVNDGCRVSINPEFRDHFGHDRKFGVMADEVASIVPDAIVVDENGYSRVDYGKLGIVLH